MRKSKKIKIGKIFLVVIIISVVGYFAYDQIFAVSYPHKVCQWRCGSATTQTYGEYPTAECSGAWELEWCKCCVASGQACQDDMTPCQTTTTTIPITTTTTIPNSNGPVDYTSLMVLTGGIIALVGGVIYFGRKKR